MSSGNKGVPRWHPEYVREEDRRKITLAHDLPAHLLLNAINRVSVLLLDSKDVNSVTLVGARELPILDDHEALVPGELVLCIMGCCVTDTGTFTIISDTEMIELLANAHGVGPADLFPRCGKIERFDGRTCYVAPADNETKTPWAGAGQTS